MLIKGLVEEILDNYAIVVFEDYDDISFWFDKKDLPEGAREGVLIDIEAPDDAVIPTEHSIKEPYESNGLFRGIRVDYEETERRTEVSKNLLRKLGVWNL